jgi:HK97 family phage major capsid protein
MLIEDAAFDVAGIASDLIGEAFALGEDNVFINGTGTAQPMGLLAQAEADGPSAVHLGDTAVPTQAGLLNLEAALPSQYERGAAFLARKATYSVLRTAAQTTSGQVLWGSSMVGGYLQPQPPSLLGYPALRSEFVPAIASAAYSLILGQFSGYTIVDRVGLSIQRLSEIYAETDITLLLARRRVGGFCTEPWRFKLGQMSA